MPVININIHNVTYKEYAEFVTAYTSGQSRKAMKLAQKFILSWDYEKPLDVDGAVLKLGVGQAAAVIRTLFESFTKLSEDAKTGEVTVSFDDWDMDRFSTFDELRQAGKVSEYEPLLHEVATAKGVKKDEPLSLFNGILFVKAVSEHAKKVFQGEV